MNNKSPAVHNTQPPSINADHIKGFLDPEEGQALYLAALTAGLLGPVVEIGAYCGKSALYLGAACKKIGATLFSIDHHRGSEENQPGWDYHDPDLWDGQAGSLDTLPHFRRTIRQADLEDTVIAIVGRSQTVAAAWGHEIGMLFIDGGHSMPAALADYRGWATKLATGGTLAIHDVFPNPEDGGRPPFEIYQLACQSGLFEPAAATKSLRLLTRT
jgi:predicted O-methyltransferase YrrM